MTRAPYVRFSSSTKRGERSSLQIRYRDMASLFQELLCDPRADGAGSACDERHLMGKGKRLCRPAALNAAGLDIPYRKGPSRSSRNRFPWRQFEP